MEKNLNFSAALVRIKKGDHAARAAWPKKEHLEYVKEGGTILHVRKPSAEWEPTLADILANDWQITFEADL